jgi:hypothetical protein
LTPNTPVKKDPPRFDRRACLARARNILDGGDDLSLRYACLELRFCIEAITYDKLRTYAPRLPVSVFENWQPPQAVKALLEIEPDAAASFSLRIREEDGMGNQIGEWMPLGTHNALPLPWLRKTYNKLGNYLHIPTPRQQELNPKNPDPEKLRADLEEIMAKLQPVVENTIDASIAKVSTFTCTRCEKPVVCNVKGLQQTKKTTCMNPNCGTQYRAEETAPGEFSFQLIQTPVNCLKCEQELFLETQHIEVGRNFRCDSCGTTHTFVLGYNVLEHPKADDAHVSPKANGE